MTEIKNFDGDISVGRHAVVGGDAKVCGGMTVGKNLKVEGWLDAKNLKAANKGVFLNEESLKKAYPVPKDGWWALVGDTLPAALWVAADGEWGNTGGTGGDILLESEVLADIKERLARAQEGVDAATTKNAEQDNRLANAEGQNTKQNERLINYVYPKLYQLNEGAGVLPFDGMYSGSASVLSGRKTVAEEGYTYKVVFALGKFLLQEISPGGVTIGLYEEWDKIISERGSSEDYAKRDRLYYVYTEGEGSYYYYVDADGNISEKSGTYVLRKLIDETKAKVSTNTEKLDVQERYVAALNAASSEHSQKIEEIEGRAGNIEEKNSDQDKKIVSLINRLNKQEEVVVALAFHGFTDAAADSLMLFKPKDTYSYRVLFSTASNSFVLSVTENVNQTGKYIGTYSSWNAVDGAQASSYYERRDTLYKYLDLSYGAYRYYYYGEDGSFFEAPGTKYLSKIIEKQGGKIDENTQKVEELQEQVSSIERVEDTPWEGHHMNTFTETGEYHIHGERTDANDGLPILNAASGHTIDARLTVLDSSLTNGTGAKTDIVVTQFLRLSNRTGGDGHVYVRTGQAATKAELTATDSTKWSTWEKLMGMFEKNAVTNIADLNTYTTNGMYSGLFQFEGMSDISGGVEMFTGSTFLVVTVNGYAVASAGLTPQLTQMLYLLPAKNFNAPAKMYLRTAAWDASAKSWNYQNWDKIATANDLSPITAEVQSAKTLANNNAGRISDVEGRVSGAEGRIAAIENTIPEEGKFSAIVELGKYQSFAAMFAEAAKFERVTNDGLSVMHGTYVLSGDVCNSVLILQQVHKNTDGSGTAMQHIYIEKRRFTRYINFSTTAITAVQGVQNDGARNLFFNTATGKLLLRDMWSNNIGDAATLPNNGSLREGTPTLSTVPLVLTKTFGDTVTATLMPATSARAGVMTAADKEKLDALSIGEGGGTVDNALLTEVQEKAQSAQTTADNANTAAQEAKATADGIAAKANSASIAATEAKDTANAAKAAADVAQTTANELGADITQRLLPALEQLCKGGEEVIWDSSKNLNSFVESQNYYITGERTNANDGLPILNANPGHTIFAQLSVLDSSLKNGTGAKTDICVTQVLRLSNRTGGDGHVYVRTGQASTKEELTATNSTKWGTWEKLMGIFEKNVVANATDLDTYTTNGMYSGLFMFSGYQQNWGVAITPGSTFLLVTVNGYAVSSAGLTPQLTQMLYLLPAKTGSEQFPAKMYIRTAWWNASAKDWVWANWDKIVTASELSALEARVAALEAK